MAARHCAEKVLLVEFVREWKVIRNVSNVNPLPAGRWQLVTALRKCPLKLSLVLKQVSYQIALGTASWRLANNLWPELKARWFVEECQNDTGHRHGMVAMSQCEWRGGNVTDFESHSLALKQAIGLENLSRKCWNSTGHRHGMIAVSQREQTCAYHECHWFWSSYLVGSWGVAWNSPVLGKSKLQLVYLLVCGWR